MTLSNPAQYISGRTVQEQMNSLIDYVDQRAADVALDAIASDVAQVHQDMLDADADAAAAAASAAAAAGTLANAVKKTGEASQSIAGDIAVSGALSGGSISTAGALTVTGTATVPAPSNNTDAATKKYVDDTNALDVHLAGAQAIAGIKTVPLEATGTASNQIASSQKVKNELDNYASMVRTTGNQTISGVKVFQTRVDLFPTADYNGLMYQIPNLDWIDTPPSVNKRQRIIQIADQSGNYMLRLNLDAQSDGNVRLQYEKRNIVNGEYVYSTGYLI